MDYYPPLECEWCGKIIGPQDELINGLCKTCHDDIEAENDKLSQRNSQGSFQREKINQPQQTWRGGYNG